MIYKSHFVVLLYELQFLSLGPGSGIGCIPRNNSGSVSLVMPINSLYLQSKDEVAI